jgi:hypothetical protein
MKIKLAVTLTPGDEPIEVITNLLCIAEWERTEHRKISDGKGVGITDLVSWAFFYVQTIRPSYARGNVEGVAY